MTLTQLLGINLCLIFAMSCNNQSKIKYSSFQKKEIKDYRKDYSDYCKQLENTNYEIQAVKASFFGDHVSSIYNATLNAKQIELPSNASMDNVVRHFSEIISNRAISEKEREEAKKFLDWARLPNSYEELSNYKIKVIDAKTKILEESKRHHFLLINEAHYSSENRMFTANLLEPLWKNGYRYLALETLSHDDTEIQQRGYPEYSSGYYIKDPVFGNLIRKALEIGYKLVPYETTNSNHGTERDKDQAQNIFNNTLKIDSIGKVLVHVGYSHLNEDGDKRYDPMGSQLKKLIKQDILTVEQQSKTDLHDKNELDLYYKYVKNNFEFDEPVVILDSLSRVIIDPVNYFYIDIQVYHPSIQYVKGRPRWRLTDENDFYDLPDDIAQKYQGHLILARPFGEPKNSIPIDQFIIGNNRTLILPHGKFDIGIVDCNGTLVSSLQASVK